MGFKLPLPLFVMLLLPPALVTISLLVRFPSLPHGDDLAVLSNGTHDFHPTTILLSIDGFRPDYLERRDLVPNILAMGKEGMRARSMQPIFPSLTFPNHWAMLTGLYAESHGIVANDFWAPDVQEEFSSRNKSSWDSRWWWGEPMWSVAERGGRRSAQMMWPGPPTTAEGISPSFWVEFRESAPLEKLPELLSYFDKPIDEAPSLILTYLPDVDVAGHSGGPESKDVEDALVRVDNFVGALRDALAERNLSNLVDLIVVSDHGMAATSAERLIFLDDLLGEGFKDLEHRDGWPSLGLRFGDQSPVHKYLDILQTASENGTFSVFTHETMPERWHFSYGARVAPMYLVPKLGWVITDHDEFDRNSHNGVMDIKGAHGYDNAHAEMQAIFFAQGPWAKRVKAASGTHREMWETTSPAVLKSFRNLELFNLIMSLQSLDRIAPPNNGTRGFWDKLVN
ncbi:Phosphodiest-domain-containing protein [Cutaneotrichosporon oleaginosum]|uniref:Phosphodiest-domain-containing protein n=1 Tax=Cutaneotrichosporon oleaginosum TaxID=879819 RepID=A0A0J0XHZ8_9TREE|nr:Phosphodiest-domain-containing protein [Cutaneotrichosporon oleaginosum]KLT40726.1 Phosphodiest-domain-containing protein [Cutaneotrichosporon oleaginosum]TXT06818.1 hypothetical protein COLE_06149 [Cutaneotrichosporon oleaginosum]